MVLLMLEMEDQKKVIAAAAAEITKTL